MAGMKGMKGGMMYGKKKKGGRSVGKLKSLSKAGAIRTGGVKSLFGARVVGGR